jgi:hypothetical protein
MYHSFNCASSLGVKSTRSANTALTSVALSLM